MTTIEPKLAKIQQEIFHYESSISKDAELPKTYKIDYSAKLSFLKVSDLLYIRFFDDGGFLEENGVVAKLISKMPQLETLVIPSASDESFFKIGNHPLKKLIVQVGYQNQNFIDNLAKSENFNQLEYLDFKAILDYYTVDAEYFTNAESFLRLFNSKAFSTVTVFKLRNSALELDKIYELQRTKENLLFNWVNCYGGAYVTNIIQ